MRYVLIGNSFAAVAAVEAIREVDRAGLITIVSDEPHATYARPLITFWLGGSVTTEHMRYRPGDFYDRHRVRAMLGRRAARVDLGVKEIVLEDGEAVPFDKLLLATGGRPFVPPIRGMTPGVRNVRTFTRWEDAEELRALAATERRAVVVGGGLIGLKAAEGLNDAGVETTIVELGPRLLGLALDEYSGNLVAERLSRRGVHSITGTTVQEVHVSADGAVRGVTLQNGRELECGIVVIAIGVRPNADLAKSAGIAVERGIVTSETMQTSHPDVFAAGDVAQTLNLSTGRSDVIAIVPLACEQGRVAGRNMAGGSAAYRGGLPMNSVEIYGLPVMTMGQSNSDREELEHEIVANGDEYRKLVFQGSRLVGAVLAGKVDHGGVITHLIRSGRALSAEHRERVAQGEFRAVSAMLKAAAAQRAFDGVP